MSLTIHKNGEDGNDVACGLPLGRGSAIAGYWEGVDCKDCLHIRDLSQKMSGERELFEEHVLVERNAASVWHEDQQVYKCRATQDRWLGWQAGRKVLRAMIMGTD